MSDDLRERIRQQYGDGIPARSYRDECRMSEKAPRISDRPAAVALRIPWSALVSDNDKFVARRRGDKPIMAITDEYAAAKKRIEGLARDVMGDRLPLDCPLMLTARVWFPGKRGNDVTNWCKLVHDALNKIVYKDDNALHDVRWIRAGIDIDSPRAEITIAPLAPVL